MSELLAPAGSMDAFYAGIANGADAIYFGLTRFSARSYCENFTNEEVELITNYAHLRCVKVFCAMNTIIFDDELEEAYKAIDFLAKIKVDAIIVQDLALLNYLTNNYEGIDCHISTQGGIDDLEGIKLAEKLGAKRVVLAREVNIEKIKEFKNQTKMELEAFIHGALCVSYSGNCFMSGLIGLRSGNRGRCVGCCRKLYSLIEDDKIINKSYLYSMKDLNTSNYLNELSIIDSLKIEGRMKEPSYVAGIVKYYRALLDKQKISDEHIYKNFQRTYTKGYILNENNKDIVNDLKPNNFGYPIGEVIKVNNHDIVIKLNEAVNQYDQIRIGNNLEEVSYPLIKIYNKDHQLISKSNDYLYLNIQEKVNIGDIVYKTKDVKYLDTINKTYPSEYQRFPIDIKVIGKINNPLIFIASFKNIKVSVESKIFIEKANNRNITINNFEELLRKLNDTPYYLNNLDIHIDDMIFIPLKEISQLKRTLIDKLNEERLKRNIIKKNPEPLKVPNYQLIKQTISCEVLNDEQYEACIEEGIDVIYYHNIIPRNNVEYKDLNDDYLLVGGLGGINYYLNNKKNINTDYSLNVVNHESAALLFSLGVDTVTLSYEISKNNILKLIDNYKLQYQTMPKLELIAYGRQKLMVTKYCPLKHLKMCGNCMHHKYYINDAVETFPLGFSPSRDLDKCSTLIYNSKILNLVDEIDDLKEITSFRLAFTCESKDECIKIIRAFKAKLRGEKTHYFNDQINTRGHFLRDIL